MQLLNFLLLALPTALAVRVMPLGDSITGSPGCWRATLYNNLVADGAQNLDMVGSRPTQACGVAHDGDNEGHSGFQAVNIAAQNLLPGWLNTANPDVVIMHLGTNDLRNNKPHADVLTAFTKLVGQMRAKNAAIKVLVAQIIPLNPSGCADCNQRVIRLNAQIPAWATAISTAASPVKFVNQYTGWVSATDTSDGIHPNDSGNAKLAANWFAPLRAWV